MKINIEKEIELNEDEIIIIQCCNEKFPINKDYIYHLSITRYSTEIENNIKRLINLGIITEHYDEIKHLYLLTEFGKGVQDKL